MIQYSMIEANGSRFHVAEIGKRQPLLLRHGWPEFWFTREPVMTRLADRFRLIALSRRRLRVSILGDATLMTGPNHSHNPTRSKLPRSRVTLALSEDNPFVRSFGGESARATKVQGVASQGFLLLCTLSTR
jgi:hypothetical protein